VGTSPPPRQEEDRSVGGACFTLLILVSTSPDCTEPMHALEAELSWDTATNLPHLRKRVSRRNHPFSVTQARNHLFKGVQFFFEYIGNIIARSSTHSAKTQTVSDSGEVPGNRFPARGFSVNASKHAWIASCTIRSHVGSSITITSDLSRGPHQVHGIDVPMREVRFPG